MIQATLCLLIEEDKILLAMKKRGFGAGRWNGAGGKFDPLVDKNILDTAIRETKEEIGVEVKNPEKFGLFHFKFPHKPEWDQDVHLFIVKSWQGEPVETEEMAPKWFSFNEIPYQNMWADDIHWMPHILQGKKIEANFVFAEGDKISDCDVNIIKEV